MKHIFTLMFALGIVYLSSCGNGGNDSNIKVTPVPDSSSKGGNIQITLHSDTLFHDPATDEVFNIIDYQLKGKPIYSLYAMVIYNHTDSLWHCNIQLIDQKMQQVAFNFFGINNAATGNFLATSNNCTFIDYVKGDNYTYAMSISGALKSVVNITQSSYPIQGTFTFYLYHNNKPATATGSFKIYY